MEKTLGGDRLGSGKKQKVYLHGYERSTHDMGYAWRSTMAAGTLVPFICEVALPGDTFDINLNCDVKTHPTIGPLFGSYKVQLDVFMAPIRLYNSLLHNNALSIGRDMSQVKIPQITLPAVPMNFAEIEDLDNAQINPSCILSYLGIRGVGIHAEASTQFRNFNAIPLLAYWDIYKNYYSNKQEEIGAVLHTPSPPLVTSITSIEVDQGTGSPETIPGPTDPLYSVRLFDSLSTAIHYTMPTPPNLNTVLIVLASGQTVPIPELFDNIVDNGAGTISMLYKQNLGDNYANQWKYKSSSDGVVGKPDVVTFPLSNIDLMRENILAFNSKVIPFQIPLEASIEPYVWLGQVSNGIPNIMSSQEGLALKTYQSDLLNNWLKTEWIDGPGGISEVTAIDTSEGSFTIDTLNLSKKIYLMMNRIAVSGGTYNDWLDAVYTHDRFTLAETPMYMGGLIKELVFQEVVNNSGTPEQPLGTLAGKGVMDKKHKGGHVTVKVDEPAYVIGIASLTPRLDYSQGNKWDVHLQTLDDLHKPQLDEIGFQDLITEQMAWWDTHWDGLIWAQNSAGKQPAWINYMTNVNQTRGNFAVDSNEMFMTLNRRYERGEGNRIADVTTYIDPSKFNFIFAETSLDAQNFWVQIGIGMEVRRKMSARVMPNL